MTVRPFIIPYEDRTFHIHDDHSSAWGICPICWQKDLKEAWITPDYPGKFCGRPNCRTSWGKPIYLSRLNLPEIDAFVFPLIENGYQTGVWIICKNCWRRIPEKTDIYTIDVALGICPWCQHDFKNKLDLTTFKPQSLRRSKRQ